MENPTQRLPQLIKINLIDQGNNPRRFFDEEAHRSLVISIRNRGLLQPIGVREKGDGRYELVYGERRWRAVKEVESSFGQISAIVYSADETVALELAVIENEERQDPSRTEQADAAHKLMERYNGDRDEVARQLGWSLSKLDRHLALAKLTPAVKAALDERKIKLGHAELLATVPADKQETALATVMKANLSVDKTAELLLAVTHSLPAACFDKTECAGCPFNSATQRALFETAISDGHCTNPSCYEMKTKSHQSAVQQAEAEQAAAAAAAAAKAAPPAPATVRASGSSSTPAAAAPAATAPRPVPTPPPAARPAVPSGTPLADCRRVAKEARETQWRRTCANAVVHDPVAARIIIMAAAYDGTLNDIQRGSLKLRADRLFGAGYADQSFPDRLAMVAVTDAERSNLAFAAIAGAYIMEVKSFDTVVAIGTRWGYDIRADWCVDKKFLDLFTKPMLKEIAFEAGLVGHMGEKVFARLYGGKRDDLIKGMLNATGFSWKGILPSAMTLDGAFGRAPAPAPAAQPAPTPAASPEASSPEPTVEATAQPEPALAA